MNRESKVEDTPVPNTSLNISVLTQVKAEILYIPLSLCSVSVMPAVEWCVVEWGGVVYCGLEWERIILMNVQSPVPEKPPIPGNMVPVLRYHPAQGC